MSQSGIFIQLLLAVVEADGERFSRSITDISVREEGHGSERTRRATTQGPLSAGSYIALGSFRQIAQWVSPDSREYSRWQSLEIRVIFFYGTDYAPVAAYRRFAFHPGDNNKSRIRPRDADTRALRSWRYRRRIQRWLRENM